MFKIFKKQNTSSNTKKVPISVNNETGEKYLNFSYMILSSTAKKLQKLRAWNKRRPATIQKHLYLTGLRLIVLAELIMFEVSYFFGERITELKNIKSYALKWFPQRFKRGFDDRELWNLDMTLVEFIIKYLEPRIEGFIQMKRWGYPYVVGSQEEWNQILKEILEGFKIIKEHGSIHYVCTGDKKEEEELERKAANSVRLFSKYWTMLWD